jgi:GNAT superfamily N-acetyltransferase
MDKVYPAMLARQHGIPSLLHSTLRAMRQYDCWRLRSYLSIGDRTRGAIECIGGATALRFDDVGYFNRVYDFGADTVARIDEIMEFYGIHGRLQAPAGTTPRRGVELIAGEGFELSDAADTLRRHGFQPAKRMVRLGMELSDSDARVEDERRVLREPAEQDCCFRPLACPEEVDAMLSLYLEGFNVPRERHASAKVNMRELVRRPELHIWVACRGSDMIGLGMLYQASRTALLAAGVTRDAYRQQGIHRRLIELRIRRAARTGCRSIVTWTDHGGASHRNLQSQGMRMLRGDWVWRNDVS